MISSVLCIIGKGVSKNLIEAKDWFRKAAVQGDDEALQMMKRLTEMVYESSGS
jgi:TPR repeat protein